MAPRIKAREVLSDLKNVPIMNTLVLLNFFLFVYFLFNKELTIIWHTYFGASIGCLYFYMVIEDFMYQTIDMRIWLILFTCMQLYAAFSYVFYLDFAIGLFLFYCLFSFSWKSKATNLMHSSDIEDLSKPSNIMDHQIGFLPSLGIALTIGFVMDTPYIEEMSFYSIIISSLVFKGFMALLIISLFYRELKRYRDEKNHKEILYMMGNGDVWVCALWFGFYGLLKFGQVFFIALWIQLFFYIFYYFLQKRDANETSR